MNQLLTDDELRAIELGLNLFTQDAEEMHKRGEIQDDELHYAYMHAANAWEKVNYIMEKNINQTK